MVAALRARDAESRFRLRGGIHTGSIAVAEYSVARTSAVAEPMPSAVER